LSLCAGSIDIILLIIKSTFNQTIEDYALDYVTTNNIGEKNNNRGLLILIAISDRKVRLEFTDKIADLISEKQTKEIIDEYFVPNFKKGDFFIGIKRGIETIDSLLCD
jgi:uncharacterized protein